MSIDTTGSLTPIDLDTPLMVSPSGGDPTPLPQTRAADGTRQLKALPPPIPARASTADLIAQPRTQTAQIAAGVDAPALAGGTKTKLRAAPRATLPPPIPTAGRSAESVATESGPAIARTKTPVPPPNRAKGTVPPIRPLTADPDGWSVSAADSDTPLPPPDPGLGAVDDSLRDIMSTDDESPDSTRPTPFVEPAVTAPIAAEPSKEWLAKIDQVMRPEANPPVMFTTNAALPTTKAATEMFAAKAEAPSMTQPLELVDLDEVPGAAPASVVVTPSLATPVAAPPAPVVQQAVAQAAVEQPAAAPVWKPLPSTRPLPAPRTLPPPSAPAAVAASIGAAPALPRPRPSSPAMSVPVVPAAPAARMTGTGSAPVVDAAPAFEQSFDVEFDSPDMTSAHTTNFEMPATQSFVSKRMKLALVGGVAVMLVAYLATRGGHKTTTPKPAQTAQVEAPAAAAPVATPAAAPVAAPAAASAAPATTEPAAPAPAAQNIAAPAAPTQEVAAAPAPAAGMVRMPVTSKPSGALVTFVDGGKAVVVGRTPTTIEFDPRSSHDVALTLLDHETQLVTIPTGGMTALVVDMGAAKTGAAVPAVAHVATEVATRTETPAPKHHTAAPAPRAPVQHVAQPAPRMEETAPSGAGMLMISSKPPCEIVVDGKSTHLMTPQKSIPLAAGNHTIVLVNAGAHVHKTLGVIIQSKKSTKVIQDFTKH